MISVKYDRDAGSYLPADGLAGTLVGRAWVPGQPGGPSPVALRRDGVFDLAGVAPTVSGLLGGDDPAGAVCAARGVRLGSVEEIITNSLGEARDPALAHLLAPCDLQPVKACGVTFAVSLLERVIEEKAKGSPERAAGIRRDLMERIGSDLAAVRPGSDEAVKLMGVLKEQGLWSQYLEVGIGPDAEVFTKCPPLASVGLGQGVGIHPRSSWNNPEPEVVLVINGDGRIIGAALGNDVNSRDFEGRSSLLLGRAKDFNGSAAIGPFVRLFDETFSLEDLRSTEITLLIQGDDGFVLQDRVSLSAISRDITDLAGQAFDCRQHPDGLMLFTGTMFAPIQDRDAAGQGFTHKPGDLVSIASDQLGKLANRVSLADTLPSWNFGTGALIYNLKARHLL